jgi:hypothetical protein
VPTEAIKPEETTSDKTPAKEDEKMSYEEEQLGLTKRTTKKRPICEDSDQEQPDAVIVEKEVKVPDMPSSKKVKNDQDGEPSKPIKVATTLLHPPAKPITQNSAVASKKVGAAAAEEDQGSVGPPKNLEKLRPLSNAAYEPVEDAPFYKG